MSAMTPTGAVTRTTSHNHPSLVRRYIAFSASDGEVPPEVPVAPELAHPIDDAMLPRLDQPEIGARIRSR